MKAPILLMGLFAFAIANSQGKYQVVYQTSSEDSVALAQVKPKTIFVSQQQSGLYLDQFPAWLQSKGYLAASVDSLQVNEDQTVAHIFMGKAYQLGNLQISAADMLFINQAGGWSGNKMQVNFEDYRRLRGKLLDQFERLGYPFAQVKLDSINFVNQEISAQLVIDKGLLYRFDSIHLVGPAKISRNFIHNYLDIPRGSLYNQQKLDNIDKYLLELPYLQQVQPWDVTMLNTGSIVNLYLAPKKSNQVNVLAGFLPDNRQLGGGKLLFTIDANLQLKNAFGSGEQVGIVWQQIQPGSPRLNLVYQQPFIFNSPFGIDASFDLFKKDSIFLNIDARLGARYQISTRQSVRISLQSQQTNVLQVDTFRIKATRSLPEVADVSSINLAADYELNTTNYRFNPARGAEVAISLAVGKKNLRKNTSILQIKEPGFNFNTLYDSLQLNTYQLRFKGVAAYFFKLGRQSVLKTSISAGLFESPNSFRNEFFQIGGYRLLRGFDEESIYTNRYAVASVEYRYLLGLNSYFFGFSDVGYSRYNTSGLKFSNSYLGAGMGLAFETKGGIFNISYAAGIRNDLPFNLKESKIHLGYVSIF